MYKHKSIKKSVLCVQTLKSKPFHKSLVKKTKTDSPRCVLPLRPTSLLSLPAVVSEWLDERSLLATGVQTRVGPIKISLRR